MSNVCRNVNNEMALHSEDIHFVHQSDRLLPLNVILDTRNIWIHLVYMIQELCFLCAMLHSDSRHMILLFYNVSIKINIEMIVSYGYVKYKLNMYESQCLYYMFM